VHKEGTYQVTRSGPAIIPPKAANLPVLP